LLGQALRAGLGQALHAGSHRWRWIALLSIFVPLSFVLVQCGRAPSASALAANVQGSGGDTFVDRFPQPQFNDRFPSASESLVQRQSIDAPPKRTAQAEPAPYRVASLAPTVPYGRSAPREDLTTLVSLKSSAFPYLGNNPHTDEPFLNVSKGGRRGHRSYGGRVYWQDETYSDNRVLMHVPENFDIRKPGVIVVFFHGNGATLERDVRDRQLVPQQISESGANAVLLAPQLAVDAADSSAGKFWQPGAFKRFIAESADHLAQLYGDSRAARAFANMPIVVVGYSGGFMPTAWSLDVGGISNRVRGVVLLDALYAGIDQFADWIADHRSTFFVSSYTPHTAHHNADLEHELNERSVPYGSELRRNHLQGMVTFLPAGDVSHRDFVTHAWTDNPVQDILLRMNDVVPKTDAATVTARRN